MARPPRLLAGALLATAVLQCTSPSNTSHCANGWSRHSDQSWAVVEASQPDADGDFGRDTGPVIYLGTYVSTGECAAACRAYTHMDTTCEGFTHYHLSHLTRPLQCLGAVSGTLSVNGKLESSRAMSGILFSLPRVRGPELVVNHPWQGDVITSQELLYLEWLWTSLEDGAVTIVFSGALDVRVENVAMEAGDGDYLGHRFALNNLGDGDYLVTITCLPGGATAGGGGGVDGGRECGAVSFRVFLGLGRVREQVLLHSRMLVPPPAAAPSSRADSPLFDFVGAEFAGGADALGGVELGTGGGMAAEAGGGGGGGGGRGAVPVLRLSVTTWPGISKGSLVSQWLLELVLPREMEQVNGIEEVSWDYAMYDDVTQCMMM